MSSTAPCDACKDGTVTHIRWGCPYCLQLFTNAGDLEGHVNEHIITVLFETQRKYCKRIFGEESHTALSSGDNISSKHSHESSCDNIEFTCPWAGCANQKNFSRRDGLQRHFNTHINVDIVCEFCGTEKKALQEWHRHWENVCSKKERRASMTTQQKTQLDLLKDEIKNAKALLAEQLEQRKAIQKGKRHGDQEIEVQQANQIKRLRPSSISASGETQQGRDATHLLDTQVDDLQRIFEDPDIIPKFGSFQMNPLDSEFDFPL